MAGDASDGGKAGDAGPGEAMMREVPRDAIECGRLDFLRRLMRGLLMTTLPQRRATSADSGKGKRPALRMPPGPPARRSEGTSPSQASGSAGSSESISRSGQEPRKRGSTSMLVGVCGRRDDDGDGGVGGGGGNTRHCSPAEIMLSTRPSSVPGRPPDDGRGGGAVVGRLRRAHDRGCTGGSSVGRAASDDEDEADETGKASG